MSFFIPAAIFFMKIKSLHDVFLIPWSYLSTFALSLILCLKDFDKRNSLNINLIFFSGDHFKNAYVLLYIYIFVWMMFLSVNRLSKDSITDFFFLASDLLRALQPKKKKYPKRYLVIIMDKRKVCYSWNL